MLYVYRGSRGDFFDRWALYFRWKLAYFFIIGGFGCSTDKKTVKKIFFWKSNNGFLLMALKLSYMWNVVAKFAKTRKSIFSRVNPNNNFNYFFSPSSVVSVIKTHVVLVIAGSNPTRSPFRQTLDFRKILDLDNILDKKIGYRKKISTIILMILLVLVIIIMMIIVLAKIINRLFHEKSTKQPYRSQGNTNL